MTVPAPAAAIRRRVPIPLRFTDGYAATADAVSFTGLVDSRQHLALELGRPSAAGVPLVRLHSECLTGDVFGSQRCDCGPQLREAVERIAEHVPTGFYLTEANAAYLATKARRGGHDRFSPAFQRVASSQRVTEQALPSEQFGIAGR